MAQHKQQEQKPSDNKPLVPPANNALTVVDFGADAGAGMENVSADEYRIPFLRIIDPKSPQARPVNMPGGLGASGGDVLNTALSEFIDGKKGFEFIPVFRDHNFIEWIPKNDDGSGGGFVGVHSPDEQIVGQLRGKHGRFGKLPMENGNELAETFYLYGLQLIGEWSKNEDGSLGDFIGDVRRVMIAFASTQIPKYQNLIGRYMNIKYQGPGGKEVLPPLWAHRWEFKTEMQVKGTQSWYGWKITLAEKDEAGNELKPFASLIGTKHPVYATAKSFFEMIRDGKVEVNYNNARSDTGTDTTQRNDTTGAESDDIPM